MEAVADHVTYEFSPKSHPRSLTLCAFDVVGAKELVAKGSMGTL